MSPTMTVVVLVVLWLIVVVPMILRRNDERARERSVEGFGRAMRLLNRRAAARGPRSEARDDPDDATYVMPRVTAPRREVFVSGATRPADRDLALATRRPVPVAEEALMYPADRNEMSAARKAMMARRRRSLGVLGVGTVLTLILGVTVGGALWLLTVLFLAGLGGYLFFLRNQALKDRERRASRQLRSAGRRSQSYEATSRVDVAPPASPAMVHIDDDDVELQNLDTVDLTGLYDETMHEDTMHVAAQRRAG